MLKRSLVTMCVVGLMTTGAMAEAIIQYDTGHEMGPHFLTPGVPTVLTISVLDSTGSDWGIGGVIFDFDDSDGGLSWDLDGLDDEGFTEDDGFNWQSGLGGPPDGGNDFYLATVDPAQSGFTDFNPDNAVPVPANGKLLLATVLITGTGNIDDELTFVAGDPSILIFEAEFISTRVIKDGSEQVTLTLIPEPATLLLMGVGGFCALRRRR